MISAILSLITLVAFAEGPRGTVDFHIRAGTGGKSWNTKADPVRVSVGQTLRIINDDSVTHQLHTSGEPCEHGDAFSPGETSYCEITSEADPETTELYDHRYGPTARFYVKATK